jgi:hypothetical protein
MERVKPTTFLAGPSAADESHLRRPRWVRRSGLVIPTPKYLSNRLLLAWSYRLISGSSARRARLASRNNEGSSLPQAAPPQAAGTPGGRPERVAPCRFQGIPGRRQPRRMGRTHKGRRHDGELGRGGVGHRCQQRRHPLRNRLRAAPEVRPGKHRRQDRGLYRPAVSSRPDSIARRSATG